MSLCGCCYKGATFRGCRSNAIDAYRPLDSIGDLPGCMLCDRCMPNERVAAFSSELVAADMSGDEA